MYRNILFLSVAIIAISGCSLTSTMQTRYLSSDAVKKVAYYPMHPINFYDYYPHFQYFGDERSETIDDILKSNNNEEKLKYFPNESSRIYIEQLEEKGEVHYAGMANLSASGSAYKVTRDYLKYRTDYLGGVFYVSGVGIRLKATIVTNEAGLVLSNLYGLGAAASKKQASGMLELELIGISGKPVSLPFDYTTLSAESIAAAAQALAVIKSKMYDDDIRIWPQIAGTIGEDSATGLKTLTSAVEKARDKAEENTSSQPTASGASSTPP